MAKVKIDVAKEIAEAEAERVVSQKREMRLSKTITVERGEETFGITVPDIPEGMRAQVRVEMAIIMVAVPEETKEEKDAT